MSHSRVLVKVQVPALELVRENISPRRPKIVLIEASIKLILVLARA